MYEIYLKKNEEKRIMSGHSWVYANEVREIRNKDRNGSLAAVYSSDGRYIGKGYINHASKILVRIFIRDDSEDDRDFYMNAISRADAYRKSLGFEDAYRVVFAESDGLPALIVDRYGDYLVVQCLSLGIDMRKELICDCLEELFSPKGIYERSDASVRKKEGLPEVRQTLRGDVPDEIEVCENGIRMLVDVRNGQKTGYYLDQKQNRLAARRYCRGDVLDCFCNSGGFSLNAALSADSVLSCDISQAALDTVKKNARLNGMENIETLCGDVFDVLRSFRKEKRTFDTVILDPPAFCKSANEVKDAYRGYREINLSAMKIIRSGGFLVTCSCSHYMTHALFKKMLREAASDSGRTVRTVETKSQSMDHPSLLCEEETDYLKFFVLQII